MPHDAHPQLQSQLQPHLEADETLLWADKPEQGIVFNSIDVFIVPFSIVVLGFVAFWQMVALEDTAPILFTILGIPFIAVALYLLIGRFFYDAYRRSHLTYGLTNTRVIIINNTLKPHVQSLPFYDIGNIYINNVRTKTATIILGEINEELEIFRGTGCTFNSKQFAPALEMITNAQQIHDTIENLQTK